MAFLTAVLLICRLELRTLLRSVRTWVAAAIALLITGIAILAGGAAPAERIFSGMSVMTLQIIAPLVGLVLGSVVISEEVEARTITYIFTRPIHRSALFLGRWLAVGLVASVLLGASAMGTSWGTTHAVIREPRLITNWVREYRVGDEWREHERGDRRRVRFTTLEMEEVNERFELPEGPEDEHRLERLRGERQRVLVTSREPLRWEVQAKATGDDWRTVRTGDGSTVRYRASRKQERSVDRGLWGLEPGDIRELPVDDKERPQRVRGIDSTPVDLTLPPEAAGAFAGAAALAALFYTMITAGLSIFVKRPLIFGLGYAFAFEGLLANLPGSTQALSVQHHVRSMLISGSPPELWSRFELFAKMEFFTPAEAVLRLLLIGGGVLLACAWAVQRRQFVLTS